MPLLFSYGSNNPRQLAERIGRPVKGKAAFLPKYGRVFRDWAKRWNGGVASVEPDQNRTVYGYVEPVTEAELKILDGFEGVAFGKYRREQVKVQVAKDQGFVAKTAIAYICNSTVFNPPSQKYLDAILETINSFWAEGDQRVTTKDIPIKRRNPETCKPCGGLGYIVRESTDGSLDCWSCKGTGKNPKYWCPKCQGTKACTVCLGSGIQPEQVFEARPCNFCRQTGKCYGYSHQSGHSCYFCKDTGICNECNGSGTVPRKVHPPKECYFCRGNKVCPECKGSGLPVCNQCYGRKCPKCNMTGIQSETCEYCRGLGINNQLCYGCRGTMVQDTIEEVKVKLRAKEVIYKEWIRKNLLSYNLNEPVVDLFAKRLYGKRHPEDTPSPSIFERLSGELPTLPLFYGDIQFVETIPIVDALFDMGDLKMKALKEIRKDASDFYHLYNFVEINDEVIGYINTDGYFLFEATDLKTMLMWAGITMLGRDKLLDIDFDVVVKQIQEQVLYGEDSLSAWSKLLKQFPMYRTGDGHLVILNKVRDKAFVQFLNRQVEPFNFAF